jgi:hypothetical protein
VEPAQAGLPTAQAETMVTVSDQLVSGLSVSISQSPNRGGRVWAAEVAHPDFPTIKALAVRTGTGGGRARRMSSGHFRHSYNGIAH